MPASAGWYPHPEMTNTQRYWDGQSWTDHIAPLDTASPTPPKEEIEKHGGLFAVGLVTAIILPIVGFVIGIVLMTKRGWVGAGIICMVAAVIAAVAWYNGLTPDPTYGGY